MSHSGNYHDESILFTKFYAVLIANGAARLNKICNSFCGCNVNTIIKRKERIRSQGSTFQAELKLMRFFYGLP